MSFPPAIQRHSWSTGGRAATSPSHPGESYIAIDAKE